MFILKGTIKDDKNEKFTRKDGTPGEKRLVYIEPEGSIYPVPVDVPLDAKLGKTGEKTEIKVDIFPFYFAEGKRRRAYLSIYIPKPENGR